MAVEHIIASVQVVDWHQSMAVDGNIMLKYYGNDDGIGDGNEAGATIIGDGSGGKHHGEIVGNNSSNGVETAVGGDGNGDSWQHRMLLCCIGVHIRLQKEDGQL